MMLTVTSSSDLTVNLKPEGRSRVVLMISHVAFFWLHFWKIKNVFLGRNHTLLYYVPSVLIQTCIFKLTCNK